MRRMYVGGTIAVGLGAAALTLVGCGGSGVKPVSPTVVIEDGVLIMYDEESSSEVPLQIQFELDSDVLGQESYLPLEVLADFFANHPQLTLVEVQGHTDEQGSTDYNMGLSRRRARRVVAFLVEQGVDRDRLRPRGFGDQRPATREATPTARAQNRRVEFVIVTDE